jgi:hypothetical protein
MCTGALLDCLSKFSISPLKYSVINSLKYSKKISGDVLSLDARIKSSNKLLSPTQAVSSFIDAIRTRKKTSPIFYLPKIPFDKKYHKILDNKSLWIYIDIIMWDSLI